MTKPDRFSKLSSSVSRQKADSADRFAKADIVLAVAASGGAKTDSSTPNSSLPAAVVGAAALEEKNRVLVLHVDNVLDHPRNARKLYDPTRLDDVAKSIARDGQQYPVIVMASLDSPGKYVLVDGRYRKRAIISLGRTEIKVLVVDQLDSLEAYRLSRMLNEERTAQTDLDNALAWREMLDEGDFTSQGHIADYLGLNDAKVSKTLALLELPPSIMAVMKTNPFAFGIRIGYELRLLSKTMPLPELEAVAEKINEGKMTVVELESLRLRREKPPARRERSRAYPLTVGEINLGRMREFDDGRLNIEFTSVTDSLRESIKTAIHAVLSQEASKDLLS
jgi:ParB family chromosome partitioning protein